MAMTNELVSSITSPPSIWPDLSLRSLWHQEETLRRKAQTLQMKKFRPRGKYLSYIHRDPNLFFYQKNFWQKD